jgi:3-hydroxyisobutyrate dehydrogenase-like beta-hydroxyacid dehydrogenase
MGERERIGFLGLGMMGSRMAANVARAGFPLTVWTRTPGKAHSWAQEHARSEHARSEPHPRGIGRGDEQAAGIAVADTPAEVARASDIVVSMVVDGAQVQHVLLGQDGVADGAHEGLLCVDMSTIAPAETRRIAARLAEHGVQMIDAPVTGAPPRAQAATLTIMVGGETAPVERARPLLDAMGNLVVHVGEIGQGEMAKLINNALGAANAAAVAEALVLASATGVDLDALVQVVQSGSGASAQMGMKAPAMREHDFTTLFKTDHLLKDVRLCLEEAQAAGVPFPTAAHARQLLTAAVARGHSQADYSSIVEAAEGLAGRRL